MDGLLWVNRYYPVGRLEKARADDEDELTRMIDQRRDKILWLGCRIAKCGRWI